MTDVQTIRWREWKGVGLQHVVLRRNEDGFLAEAAVVGSNPIPFAACWRILIDAFWNARRVEVELIGTGHKIVIEADGKGNWKKDGRIVAELRGALDPDISITPFTNSFPVKRLNMRKGECAEIRTAYIDIMGGSVFADPQRYTCLEEGRLYLYESLDSDFHREIVFDSDGFVATYPGLFQRLP
ncbi:MAG: putative glycolipid-binding domain-containing protein [Rhizobiaceae bacterium]